MTLKPCSTLFYFKSIRNTIDIFGQEYDIDFIIGRKIRPKKIHFNFLHDSVSQINYSPFLYTFL